MKSKKVAIHPFTELHFISNLPLKQSVQLISNVAYPHPIVLTEVNPNTVAFDIQYDTGTIEGALQRWQGDETRVNCAGGVGTTNNLSGNYNSHHTSIFQEIAVFLFHDQRLKVLWLDF